MNITTVGILNFVINVVQRDSYKSLIFLSSPNPRLTFDDEEQNLVESVGKASAIPVISLTYVSMVNITDNFNGEFLTIVDLETHLYAYILAKVAHFLHLAMRSRVLLILDHTSPNDEFLEHVFRFCWKWKLVNVIAISRDFSETQEFHSYVPYPSFHLEKRQSFSDVIYPNRVDDLQGGALRVFADQTEPLDMMSRKSNGEIELFGYAGRIIAAFAKKHNAKLDYTLPYVIGRPVFFGGLRDLLFNDTLDLVISLTVINDSGLVYSYTVEQTSYCMMLPVEKNIPTFQFYVIIMDGPSLGLTCCICLTISVLLVSVTHHLDTRRKIRLIDILLNDSCIRGLLSQFFNILKSSSALLMCIYFLMSLMGMYFTTWYLAYLQTFLTRPPTEPKIETFADLHRADFKVNMYWEEFMNKQAHALILELMEESVIEVSYNYTEYLKAMDNMNPKYSFMVPGSKWKVFEGQQKLSSKPLFRTSGMCGMIGMQRGFPMHPDSVLKAALNRVIMQDSGLLQHWIDGSFFDLVRLGRMNFSDWSSTDNGFKQLQAKDLGRVFVVFLAALFLSCLVFVGELVAGKRERLL